MSSEVKPAVQLGPGERPTPRRGPGPAPGLGPGGGGPARFMGGMSTEKALDFGASSRRLLRMLSPQRARIVTGLALGAVSVTLSVLGPKLLGNVTNLIFTGIIGGRIPAGVTKAEAVARLRAEGQGTQAAMLHALHLVPGQGVNFDQVGRTLAWVALVYAGRRPAASSRAGSWPRSCSGPSSPCASRYRPSCRGCR